MTYRISAIARHYSLLAVSLLVLAAASCIQPPAARAADAIPGQSAPPSTAPVDCSLSRKLIWCHYVSWQSWHAKKAADARYYDPVLAHPSGDAKIDYRNEVLAARAAGIDGFFVDLLTDVPKTGFGAVPALLAASKGLDFRIGVCLDGSKTPGDQVAGRLADMYARYASSPNLARMGNRLVCATYGGGRHKPDWYAALRDTLAARGIGLFIIGDPSKEGTGRVSAPDFATLPGVCDMFYSFGGHPRDGSWNLMDTPSSQTVAQQYAILARAAAKYTVTGKWMGGVNPGYLGAWFNGRNDFYVPFEGIDTLWKSWEASVGNNAAWINLSTWNDLDETALEPTLFGYHSDLDIIHYLAVRWRGDNTPSAGPDVYAIYPRESLLGTSARIEILSLPTSAGPKVSVACELRDIDGKTVAMLPAYSMSSAEAVRHDWSVPTLPFAGTPLIEPVLHIRCGGTVETRELPFIRLRGGWIENQVLVKVGIDEVGDGAAHLTVGKSDPDTITAKLSLDSATPVLYAELYRNDRPIGSFVDGSAPGADTLNIAHGNTIGHWPADKCLPGDLFTVRCETADGLVFYSNAATPFAAGLPPIAVPVLQTSVSLDTQSAYTLIDPAPPIREAWMDTRMNPAIDQASQWLFSDPDHPGADSLGRHDLVLGGGAPFYKVDAKAAPQRTTDGPGGCPVLSFDGVSQRAELRLRQLPLGAFTFDAFVRPTGPFGAVQSILGSTGEDGLPFISLLADGRISGGRRGVCEADSAAALAPNTWSHVTVTFDGERVRIYVDGALTGQTAGARAWPRFGNLTEFLGGPTHFFKGELAKVTLLDTVRPPDGAS